MRAGRNFLGILFFKRSIFFSISFTLNYYSNLTALKDIRRRDPFFQPLESIDFPQFPLQLFISQFKEKKRKEMKTYRVENKTVLGLSLREIYSRDKFKDRDNRIE